jgi:hypothetical protein
MPIVIDAATVQHNLLVRGTVTSVAGTASNAVLLDGTSGYLYGGALNTALGIGGTAAWTVEMWIKRAALNAASNYLAGAIGNASNSRTFIMYLDSTNHVNLTTYTSAAASVLTTTAGTVADTTTWHHVACGYNGTNQFLALDGTFLSTAQANVATQAGKPATTFGSAFGGAGDTLTSFFNGAIDEIQISNIARYTANFTAPTPPFTPDGNTKGLWHLDVLVGGGLLTLGVGA